MLTVVSGLTCGRSAQWPTRKKNMCQVPNCSTHLNHQPSLSWQNTSKASISNLWETQPKLKTHTPKSFWFNLTDRLGTRIFPSKSNLGIFCQWLFCKKITEWAWLTLMKLMNLAAIHMRNQWFSKERVLISIHFSAKFTDVSCSVSSAWPMRIMEIIPFIRWSFFGLSSFQPDKHKSISFLRTPDQNLQAIHSHVMQLEKIQNFVCGKTAPQKNLTFVSKKRLCLPLHTGLIIQILSQNSASKSLKIQAMQLSC